MDLEQTAIERLKMASDMSLGEDDADGETEWIDDESCWGFYGDDLLANGIPEAAGCGLMSALKSGAYEKGEAQEQHITRYVL